MDPDLAFLEYIFKWKKNVSLNHFDLYMCYKPFSSNLFFKKRKKEKNEWNNLEQCQDVLGV